MFLLCALMHCTDVACILNFFFILPLNYNQLKWLLSFPCALLILTFSKLEKYGKHCVLYGFSLHFNGWSDSLEFCYEEQSVNLSLIYNFIYYCLFDFWQSGNNCVWWIDTALSTLITGAKITVSIPWYSNCLFYLQLILHASCNPLC